MPVSINKELDYDCYAYFAINTGTNTYPIRNAEHHLEKLLSLKAGDVLFLKGKGQLKVIGLTVQDYPYEGYKPNKNYLYQEIAIAVNTID